MLMFQNLKNKKQINLSNYLSINDVIGSPFPNII